MNRRMLEKICDPHISILQNISILRENWLKYKELDNATLHIHPLTYDKLMYEISKGTQGYWYVGVSGHTIMGLPIKEDTRVRPYHLLIREEDNMEREYCKNDVDSLDAYRYFVEGFRGAGKSNKVLTPLPTKYILNQDACILFWSDDSKTIVKKAEDDMQDPVKGFLWAYFLKHSKLSRTKANKYLREIDEAYKEIAKPVEYNYKQLSIDDILAEED